MTALASHAGGRRKAAFAGLLLLCAWSLAYHASEQAAAPLTLAVPARAPATPAATAAAQLGAARAAESAGDLVSAVRLYRQLLADHPADGSAWISYGECLRFLVHDPVAASQAFSAALQVPAASATVRAYALKGLQGLDDRGGRAGEGWPDGAAPASRSCTMSLEACEEAETQGCDRARWAWPKLLVDRHDVPGALEQSRLAVAKARAAGSPRTA